MSTGLYWINYFRADVWRVLGDLEATPVAGAELAPFGLGVLLMLDEDPDAWRARDYHELEAQLRDHLGGQHFYDRASNHEGVERFHRRLGLPGDDR